MATLDLSVDHITKIWEWCSEAYLRHNIRLQFPTHTDPTKTYQWRYVKAIAQKFDEWDFDDATAKHFIQIAVDHAKYVGVLRKGLAALHQSNMMSICYDKIQSQSATNQQTINSLRHIHAWLSQRIKNKDLFAALLVRTEAGDMCNLVKWVRASRISPLYLSLSRNCCRALSRLEQKNPHEREMLPKTTTLYMLRTEFLEDTHNFDQAKSIFGSDWRTSCP